MIYAVDFIASFLLQGSILYAYSKLSNKKLNITLKVLFVLIIATLVQLILHLYISNLLSAMISIIYYYIFFLKTFKDSNTKVLINSIIIWTISILIDMLTMLFMISYDITSISNEMIAWYKALCTVLMSLLMFLIFHSKYVIKLLMKISRKMEKIYFSTKVIMLLFIAFFIVDFIGSQNMDSQAIITATIILSIFAVFVGVIFIHANFKIITLKKTNEILEKNNEINIKVITNYRILKHNLESQLLGVKTVANKKAKELLDNLILEYNNSFYIKHDINMMPTGINGLVMEKLYNYKDNDIQISIINHIKNNILKRIGPRRYNLFCEALGVTLDNALESANKSNDKIISITFDEEERYILIRIKNSFKGQIDIEGLGTLNYTSKELGHGLGLYSLIGRKNLIITTKIKDNLFINELKIKKLKSD